MATYQTKVRIKSNGMLSGEVEGEWEIGDENAPVPWDAPVVKAFLADDDLQEMTICSTNIGFVKTIRKLFTDAP